MSIKFQAHGSEAEFMALVNLLNESKDVVGVRTFLLHRAKNPAKCTMGFEVMVTPAVRYEPVYERKPRRREVEGVVYLIQTADPKVFKLGCTTDTHDRMKNFGVKLPFEVEYLHMIHTEDIYALEKWWKKRWKKWQKRDSEFYELPESEVNFFRSK